MNPDGSIADVPGWILQSNGLWVLDPSDAFLRDGILLTYTLNPTATATVTYPPESSTCANPENPPTAPPPWSAACCASGRWPASDRQRAVDGRCGRSGARRRRHTGGGRPTQEPPMRRLRWLLPLLALTGCSWLDYDAIGLHRPVVTGGQAQIDEGNVVDTDGLPGIWLAAHRSTHSSVFANLVNAEVGDEVCVYGQCYRVTEIIHWGEPAVAGLPRARGAADVAA